MNIFAYKYNDPIGQKTSTKHKLCNDDRDNKNGFFVLWFKWERFFFLPVPLSWVVPHVPRNHQVDLRSNNKLMCPRFRLKVCQTDTSPVGIYMFKVNNRNTRTRCEICSKLIKTPERCQWRRSSDFINFEHISHFALNIFHTLL